MKYFEYKLPREIGDSRLDTVLEVFHALHSSQNIIIDFGRVTHITPSGQAIIACLCEKLCESKSHVQIRNLHIAHPLLNLFESLARKEKRNFPFIEDYNLTKSSILIGKSESLAPEIQNHLQTFQNEISEENIWYANLILNELTQNALDHANAERYFIYIGKNEDQLQFGVMDLGVSLPAKMAQKYQCENDQDYIKLSLEYAIGTRRTRSGGLGLNHTINILKNIEGRLVIISRNAQLRKYFKTGRQAISKTKAPLTGTWCMAQLPLEKK